MTGKSSRTSKRVNLDLLILLLVSPILSGCASVSVDNQNQSEGGNVGNITQKGITNSQPNLDPTPQANKTPSANTKPANEFVSKGKFDEGTQSFLPQAPRNNPEKIGELQRTCIFEDRLTTKKQKQCYRFSLSKSSNASFYVDRVTEGASVSINLAVDTNNNSVVDDGESIFSRTVYGGGSIVSFHQLLGEDSYSFCIEFDRRNTEYRLQLVNNLSEMEQLTPSAPKSGSLRDTNIQDYYQFKLDRTQSVSLVVSQNTAPVQMNLYVDNNSNGVINESENEYSLTKYPDNDQKIKKTLSAGTYFITLIRDDRNTDYNLTLLAQ